MKSLKIFVWEEFATDYTSGLAIAIAKTEAEARELILKKDSSAVYADWGPLTVYPLKKCAFAAHGGG